MTAEIDTFTFAAVQFKQLRKRESTCAMRMAELTRKLQKVEPTNKLFRKISEDLDSLSEEHARTIEQMCSVATKLQRSPT